MTYKEINPNFWKPEKEGDSIEGILIHKEQGEKGVRSSVYKLELAPGEFMNVWGSTILDDRMTMVMEGDKVRITLKQKTKNTKKQDLHIYKVEVDK